MKKYLVTQTIITKKEVNRDTNDVNIDINVAIIVRIVDAESKMEAVGKFIIATQHIEAQQKLNVNCSELDDILTLS